VPLGLDAAILIALDNSRRIRIAERRILIAENRVDEMYTYLIPRVTAEGRAQARSNDTGGKFDDMTFTLGDRRTASASVNVLVPIYTFGIVQSRVAAEELRTDIEAIQAERTRNDLIFAVSQAYYRTLEAQKIRDVLDESIRVVERQVSISRDFLAQGLVAKSDVLSAEVQLANRRQQRIQAENNVQLALATLNRLLELDIRRATRLVDVLEVAPWQGSFESLLEVAFRARPDLKAYRREVDLARADYRVTRDSNNPYLYGYGGYRYSSDSFLLNDDWLEGGLVFTVPIFDGLETRTRLRRKAKEIDEAIDLHDQRADDAVLEVKRAHLNLREAAERIPVTRKAVEQAEENLRVIRDQYAEGFVTSTDVLTEEERLSRARSNYYQALYDYHAAWSNVVYAIGGEPPPTQAPPLAPLTPLTPLIPLTPLTP
jgi:outer membrane protein TolC